MSTKNNHSDSAGILVVVLFTVLYFSYKAYLDQKYPERHELAQKYAQQNLAQDEHSNQKIQSDITETSLDTPRPSKDYNLMADHELLVDSQEAVYKFNQDFGGLESVHLNNYLGDHDPNPINLVDHEFIIKGSTSYSNLQKSPIYDGKRLNDKVIFSHYEGEWLINQSYSLGDSGYVSHIEITWKNIGSNPQSLESYVQVSDKIKPVEDSSLFDRFHAAAIETNFIAGKNGENDTREKVKDFCSDESKNVEYKLQNLDYIGLDTQYFIKAIVPETNNLSYRTFGKETAEKTCKLSTVITLNQGTIQAGEQVSIAFKTWMGPKSSDLFEVFEPKLEATIDYGIVGFVARPLFVVLKFLNSLFHNWGLAIIVLTFILKVLFYPLVKKAHFAMQKTKLLQPEIDRIRNKYKDDENRQRQEIMMFMSQNQMNPLKGCLPMLVQLPVFFGFFRLLYTSIELRQAPFAAWITDLSLADPYYITPMLLTALMIVQQKLTPTGSVDKAVERIMMLMPVFFGAIMIYLPAGLVLYNITNSLVSILQSQWLNQQSKDLKNQVANRKQNIRQTV